MLRTIDQILTAERLTAHDDKIAEVDVLYSRLHACMTCPTCAGFGVKRPDEAGPTASQLVGTDRSSSGVPTGKELTKFALHYSRNQDAPAALAASGLDLCDCRMLALEFVHAIREEIRQSIILPTTAR